MPALPREIPRFTRELRQRWDDLGNPPLPPKPTGSHDALVDARYNPETGTVDMGGLHVATTKKYRDVQANRWAALCVDDLVSVDPWRARFLEIRGRAEAVPSGGAHLGPGFGEAFIRLHPEKVNSFGLE
jgi:PPOX class F420-dependent enzyme/OxyR family protein